MWESAGRFEKSIEFRISCNQIIVIVNIVHIEMIHDNTHPTRDKESIVIIDRIWFAYIIL